VSWTIERLAGEVGLLLPVLNRRYAVAFLVGEKTWYSRGQQMAAAWQSQFCTTGNENDRVGNDMSARRYGRRTTLRSMYHTPPEVRVVRPQPVGNSEEVPCFTVLESVQASHGRLPPPPPCDLARGIDWKRRADSEAWQASRKKWSPDVVDMMGDGGPSWSNVMPRVKAISKRLLFLDGDRVKIATPDSRSTPGLQGCRRASEIDPASGPTRSSAGRQVEVKSVCPKKCGLRRHLRGGTDKTVADKARSRRGGVKEAQGHVNAPASPGVTRHLVPHARRVEGVWTAATSSGRMKGTP